MGIFADMKGLATDCWHGSRNVFGDMAGLVVDFGEKTPTFGNMVKDELGTGADVRDGVNKFLFGSAKDESAGKGNDGNHAGTVIGGTLGATLMAATGGLAGPWAPARGMMAGSAIGGAVDDIVNDAPASNPVPGGLVGGFQRGGFGGAIDFLLND
jgi:hypothetical protein